MQIQPIAVSSHFRFAFLTKTGDFFKNTRERHVPCRHVNVSRESAQPRACRTYPAHSGASKQSCSLSCISTNMSQLVHACWRRHRPCRLSSSAVPREDPKTGVPPYIWKYPPKSGTPSEHFGKMRFFQYLTFLAQYGQSISFEFGVNSN